MYKKFIKKYLDIFFGVIFLILLTPIWIIIYLYLLAAIGKPVIFKDQRAGINGYPFTLFKFRTMAIKKNNEYSITDDKKRVLKKTLFFRASRLDEIPQLINVVKGELSLVGPRPLLLEYNSIYSLKHRKRLEIRPGITGWSQINMKLLSSWSQKFDLDVWYVNNVSLILDLKIILKTFVFLIKGLFNKNRYNNNLFSEKFNGKN
jgi:lipopolysaccharide/colanic/teichoic acid biosynthesis glycosyltransferase